MLVHDKNIHAVFTQAMIRNLAFLRIQSGLHLIIEFINDSYGDIRPGLLKRVPDAIQGTTTGIKLEECSDAYSLIDCLEDNDITLLVNNVKSLPYGKRIEDAVPEQYLDDLLISAFLPDIKEAIHLIKDTPLYQDILVSAVTAFEVYLRDTLHDLIVSNGEVAKKFEKKIRSRLNLPENLEMHRSVKQLIAHEITNISSFYRVRSIEDLFDQCFWKHGTPKYRIHTSDNKRDSIQYYLKLRHLLVHNGGIIDQRFMNETKCKYSVGERHPVREQDVDEFIGYTQGIAERIEEEIANY